MCKPYVPSWRQRTGEDEGEGEALAAAPYSVQHILWLRNIFCSNVSAVVVANDHPLRYMKLVFKCWPAKKYMLLLCITRLQHDRNIHRWCNHVILIKNEN